MSHVSGYTSQIALSGQIFDLRDDAVAHVTCLPTGRQVSCDVQQVYL